MSRRSFTRLSGSALLAVEGYQSYLGAVGPLIVNNGGEVLVAGPGSEVVEGNPGAVTVVLKFPSMEALRDWYDSPEYQEIRSRRTDNTERGLVFANEYVRQRDEQQLQRLAKWLQTIEPDSISYQWLRTRAQECPVLS